MFHTLFSSMPPSSVTKPEYGYSRGTAGLFGTNVALTTKPNPTNARVARVKCERAVLLGTAEMSGPHMDRISSFSWSYQPKKGYQSLHRLVEMARTHYFSKIPAHLHVIPTSRRPTLFRDPWQLRISCELWVDLLLDESRGCRV